MIMVVWMLKDSYWDRTDVFLVLLPINPPPIIQSKRCRTLLVAHGHLAQILRLARIHTFRGLLNPW